MGIMRDIQEVTSSPPAGMQSDVVVKAEHMRKLAAQQGRQPPAGGNSSSSMEKPKPVPVVAFREW